MKTSELLQRYGISLKKSLGQHFLSTQDVARKIVKSADISNEDTVVEIGAGAGTLTEELAKVAMRVVTFEIDKRFEKLLKDRLSGFENVELIFDDFLKADLSFLPEGFVYVANIPYNITGPIIEKILKEGRFRMAVLMVQKEVAHRMLSSPGSKTFGYLSALVQSFCKVFKILDVPRSFFVPNPDVDSVVVKLVPRGENLPFRDFRAFLSKIFAKKRKTLKNNMKGWVEDVENVLEKLGIDPMTRAEALTVEQIKRLYIEVKGG